MTQSTELTRRSAVTFGVCAILLGGLSGTARAAGGWAVDPTRSTVAFDYSLDGTARSGLFGRFEGGGSFDPDRPTEARFDLRVDPASIDLGDRLASGYASSAEWFDVRTHGPVVFRLVRLKPLADGTYEALGDLTIKGRTRATRAPLKLRFDNGTATAEGRFPIDRKTFDLGRGPSSLVVDVSREVAVRFVLVAVPRT